VMSEGIAILNNAPHAELAKVFYEFVTTIDALKQQAEKYAKLPARKAVPRDQLPKELTAQAIEPMPLDWSQVVAKDAAWVDRWEQENQRH